MLAVLPQLLRNSGATNAPASHQLSHKLQGLRSYADDANLKVWCLFAAVVALSLLRAVACLSPLTPCCCPLSV